MWEPTERALRTSVATATGPEAGRPAQGDAVTAPGCHRPFAGHLRFSPIPSAVDSALRPVESRPQIGHKVVGRLYSNRQPNERIRDLEQRAGD